MSPHRISMFPFPLELKGTHPQRFKEMLFFVFFLGWGISAHLAASKRQRVMSCLKVWAACFEAIRFNEEECTFKWGTYSIAKHATSIPKSLSDIQWHVSVGKILDSLNIGWNSNYHAVGNSKNWSFDSLPIIYTREYGYPNRNLYPLPPFTTG